jgi:hypothetical protein
MFPYSKNEYIKKGISNFTKTITFVWLKYLMSFLMENIEKFRIIHNQFQFSKSFTLEYFKFGDDINSLNNSKERDEKIEELIRFLRTYNLNQEQQLLLRNVGILLKLSVNEDNYNKFIQDQTIYDSDFISNSYSEFKQQEIHNDYLKRRKHHSLKIFSITFIVVFIFVFIGLKVIDKIKKDRKSIDKESFKNQIETNDSVVSPKVNSKLTFCDCYEIMMELGNGQNIDKEKIKIYNEECKEVLNHGNSAQELKEFDKKMSDCN